MKQVWWKLPHKELNIDNFCCCRYDNFVASRGGHFGDLTPSNGQKATLAWVTMVTRANGHDNVQHLSLQLFLQWGDGCLWTQSNFFCKAIRRKELVCFPGLCGVFTQLLVAIMHVCRPTGCRDRPIVHRFARWLFRPGLVDLYGTFQFLLRWDKICLWDDIKSKLISIIHVMWFLAAHQAVTAAHTKALWELRLNHLTVTKQLLPISNWWNVALLGSKNFIWYCNAIRWAAKVAFYQCSHGTTLTVHQHFTADLRSSIPRRKGLLLNYICYRDNDFIKC